MSVSTKERKFSCYMALTMALQRKKISNPGAVATLLLECFIEDGGRLQASKVVSRGICQEGCFHSWRDEMIKAGWLVWNVNQADKGQYYPGKRLVSYINKEKCATKEIATRDEVPSKEEFEALKDKVSKIEASMKEIYETLDLGDTDPPGFEKLKQRTAIAIPN